MGDLVPRKEITKQGVSGVGGVGGGAALLLLGSIPVVGAILGAVLTVAGIAIGKSKEDRLPGTVVAGAGILAILSAIPVIGGAAGALLKIGGWGLIAFGGWSLVRFIMNLRKRS